MLKSGPENLHIHIYERLIDVKEIWVNFEKTAATSAYQTYGWSKCWLAAIGEKLKVTTKIIVGFTPSGEVVFILPLQLRKNMGLNFLEWLGAPDLMHGFGLYAPYLINGASFWLTTGFDKIVQEIGNVDVINLANMPEEYYGFEHPLKKFMNVRAPNYSYSMALQRDYQCFYKTKRSKGFRKNRLRSDRRLLDYADLYIGPARNVEEKQSALAQMFSDKKEKLGQLGIHKVFNSDQQAFIRLLVQEETCKNIIDLELIKLGKKILSVTLGGRSHDCYWYYMTAMTNGPLQNLSPGDFLLRWKIQQCCESGVGNFDFGLGDADYKTHWADKKIINWYSIRPKTVKGYFAAQYLKRCVDFKRYIKQSPLLFGVLGRVRKLRKTVPNSSSPSAKSD